MKKNHIISLFLAITLLVGGLAISMQGPPQRKVLKQTQKSQVTHKKNNQKPPSLTQKPKTQKNSSLLSIIKKYPIITGLGGAFFVPSATVFII